MNTLAKLIIASSALSLLCLLLLHFLSPEFKPSWRMISEYALGKYKPVLTAFFLIGAISSVLLPFLLWNETTSVWARIGLILIFVSGVGGFMGGLFDVKHPLHGAAFALGVPTLPVGALLVSYHLIKKVPWKNHSLGILFSAHSIWIGIVLMAVSMIVMMSGFKQAGIPMGKDATPPESVPAGVIALAGYFNRLLVLCCAIWVIFMANVYLSMPESE
ncbi:MAG: hypothetical protein C5B59_07325 [Bacteroidetes bacterium]|nr:MAG: hypothetical protein C5B59_07325 [Bacteroidota bacterium]